MRTLPLMTMFALAGCNQISDEDLEGLTGGKVEVWFNDPGTRASNMWEPDAEDALVELIDNAQVTLDFATMGFGRQRVIDAVMRANDRGVDVRFVGDAGHLYSSGYDEMREERIPMSVGNDPHIMHNKFFVVDGRFVFAGTANITDTDLRHNSNNFVYIDSPGVAADFTDEFEQMFAGNFGHTKVEIDNGRVYQVGDTEVEVWFSPNEDVMGRMLEVIDEAQASLRFTIFAFTKDQVGSAFIRKQETWDELNAADGLLDADFRERRSVAGVVDKSQLHSNNQYHEAYRLLDAGIDMRLDGNDNSKQPGDYQAGGGRLHSKTMIIDVYDESPVVMSGSFNWSSSATVSNDEFLLVLRNDEIAQRYDDYFESLWEDGSVMGGDRIGGELPDGSVLAEGDLVINEIFWYGHTENDEGTVSDVDGYDQFIEIRNLTDQRIDLDMWQIANTDDFVVGLPPGSYVEPFGTFTILDHTLEPYVDGAPQDELSAFSNGDMVVNSFNDNRQSRLYLKGAAMELFLQDPDGNVLDVAGDGGAAFHGGLIDGKLYSMERKSTPGDGADPDSWYTCTLEEGGTNVNDNYKSTVVATPDEENSTEP